MMGSQNVLEYSFIQSSSQKTTKPHFVGKIRFSGVTEGKPPSHPSRLSVRTPKHLLIFIFLKFFSSVLFLLPNLAILDQ